MNAERTHVAMLGLGAMGSALAGALLDAGHPVTVWNRTPGRADALTARGAVEAGSAAEAVAAADLTVVCLLDQASVHAVLDGVDVAGRTIVNLTSGSPAQAEETSALLTGRGARYVDGGIMAIPPIVGRPEAFVLYSGDADAYAGAEPALSAFGRPVFAGTDVGRASLYDYALLSGMYGLFAGAGHAFALVRSAGADVDVPRFAEELLVPWLQAMLASIPEQATERGVDSAASPPAMQVVGLRTMLAASAAAGVDDALTGHLRASLHALERAAAAAA